MYGDYMATHNACAGASLPLTRRPAAADCSGAQVHYMEADMRRSTEFAEPTAVSSAEDAAGAAVVAAASSEGPTSCDVGAAAASSSAPLPAPQMTAPDPFGATVPPAPSSEGAAVVPTSRPDHYAALPPYSPALYSSPPPPMVLPHYAIPVAGSAGAPPPPPMEAAYVQFVPDAIGERLDPRRFKFAPRAVMASVMPAGKRSVRCDNLGLAPRL